MVRPPVPCDDLGRVSDTGERRGDVKLIVDGNNVMGSRPDGWWRDRGRAAERLAEAIAGWAEGSREVTVVFDGHPPAAYAAPRGIQVRFADRGGRDAADDVIVGLVAAAEDAAALEVVTSDVGLADRVGALGARVRGARGFRDEVDRGS